MRSFGLYVLAKLLSAEPSSDGVVAFGEIEADVLALHEGQRHGFQQRNGFLELSFCDVACSCHVVEVGLVVVDALFDKTLHFIGRILLQPFGVSHELVAVEFAEGGRVASPVLIVVVPVWVLFLFSHSCPQTVAFVHHAVE